jgi:hypothetical protein
MGGPAYFNAAPWRVCEKIPATGSLRACEKIPATGSLTVAAL